MVPRALADMEGLRGWNRGYASWEVDEDLRLRVEAMAPLLRGKLWKLLGGAGRGPVLLRLRAWLWVRVCEVVRGIAGGSAASESRSSFRIGMLGPSRVWCEMVAMGEV